MKSYRPERVANVVRQVVSDAIASKLSDPRISPLLSITRVEVSRDLEYARVWVSVMGTDANQNLTLAGLESATGYLQRRVGGRLQIRTCPRLSFHLDDSIKKGNETIRLIEETAAELTGPPPGHEDATDKPSGDDA